MGAKMEKKYLAQLKAFLLSNQVGDDRGGYIAALERVSITHPSKWNGKLPSADKFKADPEICKVVASTKSRPIIPWWWYLDQKEPVPAVVEDVYRQIAFDYVLVFPKKNIWIYLIVEPKKKMLELLKNQENLRAFIMMSIVNKNFEPREREARRLRLGKLLQSPDIKKILTFVVYGKDYELADKIPKQIPTVSHFIDSASTTWRITYPGKKQICWSFKELVAALTGSSINI
jgi:hypothetical protein